jgi:hypothetical protein
MSNKQPKNKDWSKDREGAFNFVFHTHRWGNSANSGKGTGWTYNNKQKKTRPVQQVQKPKSVAVEA